MSVIFKNSAEFYDALYEGKDYNKEVDFVEKAIKKFSPHKVKTILSLGCGTASHDILMAQHGYSILGIDGSKEMIDFAKKKAKKADIAIDFKVADITKFKSSKKFDFTMAMFNIMGYMAENRDMDNVLKNVSGSLKKNGVFVFDCWYGPAVLKDRPYNRNREFTVGGEKFTRETTQKLDIEKSTIDIMFNFVKGGKSFAKETHKLRFWFLNELEYFLEKNGLKLVKTCNFMDLNSNISEESWNIFVIAKKK